MTTKRSVEERLIASMTEAVAIARGKAAPARTTTARRSTAPAAPAVTSDDVRSLRLAIGLSQPVFAACLNVGAETVKAWEQGKRSPDGAALRLLEIVRAHPTWLLDLVRPLGSVPADVPPPTTMRLADTSARRRAPDVMPGMEMVRRPSVAGGYYKRLSTSATSAFLKQSAVKGSDMKSGVTHIVGPKTPSAKDPGTGKKGGKRRSTKDAKH